MSHAWLASTVNEHGDRGPLRSLERRKQKTQPPVTDREIVVCFTRSETPVPPRVRRVAVMSTLGAHELLPMVVEGRANLTRRRRGNDDGAPVVEYLAMVILVGDILGPERGAP